MDHQIHESHENGLFIENHFVYFVPFVMKKFLRIVKHSPECSKFIL